MHFLSYLKPFNSDIDKDISEFIDAWIVPEQKETEHFIMFNKMFKNKEEAKKCYINMNKEFLSEHLLSLIHI